MIAPLADTFQTRAGPTLKFTDNGATIELAFLKVGQLCSASKHWTKQNDEREYLVQRFPAADPQVEMQKALQLITAKQYEKALAILIPQYVFNDDSLQTMQSRYDIDEEHKEAYGSVL